MTPEQAAAAERRKDCAHYGMAEVMMVWWPEPRRFKLCGITDTSDPPCNGCPFFKPREHVWYCFREPSTGRWMADELGHTWTNLTRDAFRIFDLRNWGPVHEWMVLYDVPHFEPFVDQPDPHDPVGERIQAKAFQFRARRRAL